MTSIAAPSSATTVAKPAATPAIAADFSMFLKLLTTQMQNQDPLNPMDSTQYTQQLAQYSQLEQTVKQSGTLTAILDRLGQQDMGQAAGLIGREARFDSDLAGLDAGPARWRYQIDGAAADADIRIADAAGNTVYSTRIDPARAGEFAWDGRLSDGGQAAAGAYRLRITARAADGSSVGSAVQSVGSVSDIGLADGALTLGVNGQRFPLAALVAVGG